MNYIAILMKKHRNFRKILKVMLFLWGMLWNFQLLGQPTANTVYKAVDYQFTAYNKIPAWTGIIVDWQKNTTKVYLYDTKKYKGHSNFVAKGLKRAITFRQFKEEVRYPEKRKYIPFFFFDLRKHPIKWKGKYYQWAIRFEDYRYADNLLGLEKTFIRAMEIIRKETGIIEKGIMILSPSPTAQPNISIRAQVEKKGYPTMSLNQLLKTFSTSTQSSTSKGSKSSVNIVLNEGEAIGYLKYIAKGKEAEARGNHKDILVYEHPPERVPLAAAILTFEPQTPLSHINLLAKNRGTPNAVVLAPKQQSALKSLNGQLVHLQLQDKSKVVITKSNLSTAQMFWNQHKALKVKIPKMDLSVKSISHFDIGAKSVQTISCIGSKAANYALLQHQIPSHVRKGFAIPFYFYDKMLKTSGTDQMIDKLVKKQAHLNVEQRKKALTTIRKNILAAKVDPLLLRELKVICQKQYKGKRIRLRSSTNCEDLPEFNGAGLYKSKGFWETDHAQTVEKKILKVYASLWTELAFEERTFFGIDHQKVGMAILINEAFREEYANGVVLTIPNLDGSTRIHINSQYGENSVTNAKRGEQAEAIFFRKEDSKWYVVESRSNIHPIFIDQAALTPLARQLQKLSIKIDYLLKLNIPKGKKKDYGVDLEFKIMKESKGYKLYIKQGRLLKL